MAIYRIKITMPDGSKGRCTGIFADGFEAVLQTLADFPEARSVAAMFIRRAGASRLVHIVFNAADPPTMVAGASAAGFVMKAGWCACCTSTTTDHAKTAGNHACSSN